MKKTRCLCLLYKLLPNDPNHLLPMARLMLSVNGLIEVVRFMPFGPAVFPPSATSGAREYMAYCTLGFDLDDSQIMSVFHVAQLTAQGFCFLGSLRGSSPLCTAFDRSH